VTASSKTNHENYAHLDKSHVRRILSRCEKEEECLVWQGAVSSAGYGNMSLTIGGKKRWLLPHRAVFVVVKGDIGDLELDHLCRNRRCCNVDHLEPVTSAENTRRGESFAAINGAKTHCKQGHRFTEENTWRSPTTGRRKCRICQSARRKKHYYTKEKESTIKGLKKPVATKES
jgi:hypothetical protein